MPVRPEIIGPVDAHIGTGRIRTSTGVHARCRAGRTKCRPQCRMSASTNSSRIYTSRCGTTDIRCCNGRSGIQLRTRIYMGNSRLGTVHSHSSVRAWSVCSRIHSWSMNSGVNTRYIRSGINTRCMYASIRTGCIDTRIDARRVNRCLTASTWHVYRLLSTNDRGMDLSSATNLRSATCHSHAALIASASATHADTATAASSALITAPTPLSQRWIGCNDD